MARLRMVGLALLVLICMVQIGNAAGNVTGDDGVKIDKSTDNNANANANTNNATNGGSKDADKAKNTNVNNKVANVTNDNVANNNASKNAGNDNDANKNASKNAGNDSASNNAVDNFPKVTDSGKNVDASDPTLQKNQAPTAKVLLPQDLQNSGSYTPKVDNDGTPMIMGNNGNDGPSLTKDGSATKIKDDANDSATKSKAVDTTDYHMNVPKDVAKDAIDNSNVNAKNSAADDGTKNTNAKVTVADGGSKDADKANKNHAKNNVAHDNSAKNTVANKNASKNAANDNVSNNASATKKLANIATTTKPSVNQVIDADDCIAGKGEKWCEHTEKCFKPENEFCPDSTKNSINWTSNFTLKTPSDSETIQSLSQLGCAFALNVDKNDCNTTVSDSGISFTVTIKNQKKAAKTASRILNKEFIDDLKKGVTTAGLDVDTAVVENVVSHFASCKPNKNVADCENAGCNWLYNGETCKSYGIYGCTDLTADNYDATATRDDDSCMYSEEGPGNICEKKTDPLACELALCDWVSDLKTCVSYVCEYYENHTVDNNAAIANSKTCRNHGCIWKNRRCLGNTCNADLCADGLLEKLAFSGVDCGGYQCQKKQCCDLPGCDGKRNSGKVNDECDVCDGDNTSCAGCDGVPNSGKVNDECGKCDGDNSSCAGCDGVPNSEKTNDKCGKCGGDNTSCAGCDGVPNSGKVNDECGKCDGDNSSCGNKKNYPQLIDFNSTSNDSATTEKPATGGNYIYIRVDQALGEVAIERSNKPKKVDRRMRN